MTASAPAAVAGRRAALLLLVALQGCAAMHQGDHPAGPGSAPAIATPESPPESARQDDQPAGSTTNAGATGPSGDKSPEKSADASTPAPCSCMDQKARTKRRHTSKTERKEAPPQLPTAPAVAHTPPGGVVDAHVEPMSVPVMSILGKRVKGAKGEDLGRVVDVLADASGRVRIAVIDFGGFLGVGNHRIAVDWPLLRFNPDGNDPSLLLSLSPDNLRTAPEYKDNPRPQTLMEVTPPAPAIAPTPAGVSAKVKN